MIRVGHVILVLHKGEVTDHLVINVVGDEYGALDFFNGSFAFFNQRKVVGHFELGVTSPETTDEQDDITLAHQRVEPTSAPQESFKRGFLVSFSMLEQGAALEVKGYFMDYIDYPEGYCLISELGCTACRLWRVPSSKVTLLKVLSLRY